MSSTVYPSSDQASQGLRAVRVRVGGSLGGSAVSDFRDVVQEVRSMEPHQLVVLDLAGLEVRDHDGLAALDAALGSTGRSTGNFVVQGVSAAAEEVLRVDRRLQELRGLRACA